MELFREGHLLLASARFHWEEHRDRGGPRGLTWSADPEGKGGSRVLHDAALRYRAQLRSRLPRALLPVDPSDGELILAGYRALGTGIVPLLEGDFALVVRDDAGKRTLLARDVVGRRPLHWGVLADGTLVAASSLKVIAAHPAFDPSWNLAALAAAAAGMHYSLGDETPWQGIRTLRAGHLLDWPDGGPGEAVPFWTPESGVDREAVELPFQRAAERLRELLIEAVRESIPDEEVTTVWMSGGWDSTAVFAAGREALRREGSSIRLEPVSISYPVGDPGREDDLIRMVADHWASPVHWISSESIDLFRDLPGGAAARDEAAAHLYERWNEALADRSREVGARVALDGSGGDQLFRVTDIRLHDLRVQGAWLDLALEIVSRRSLGWRNLKAWLNGGTDFGEGRPRRDYVEYPPPAWIRPSFLEAHRLEERELAYHPVPVPGAMAEAEAGWYLTVPAAGWGAASVSSRALRQGIEARGPLMDRRIMAFALARPVRERNRRGESKLLLRRAMRGLVPERFLAPRPSRTGVTIAYSRRSMRRAYPTLFRDLLGAPLVLEHLGIVDRNVLQRELEAYLREGGEYRRVSLFHTLQVEHWLRARTPRERTHGRGDGPPHSLVRGGQPGHHCTGQMPGLQAEGGCLVYQKPKLERFGTFRELTLIGIGSDGDGGIFGSARLDGCWIGCSRGGGS